MVPVSVLPVKKSVLPVRFEADRAFIKKSQDTTETATQNQANIDEKNGDLGWQEGDRKGAHVRQFAPRNITSCRCRESPNAASMSSMMAMSKGIIGWNSAVRTPLNMEMPRLHRSS